MSLKTAFSANFVAVQIRDQRGSRGGHVLVRYAGKRVAKNDLSLTRLRVSRAKLGDV